MRPLALSRVAAMVGGRLQGEDRTIDAVATDTRAMPAGDALFVALKGERFDGHEHVAAAARAGAVAALVSREVDAPVPQVIVADTQRALAALATAVQRDRAAKVVAITGSNGKTSVKTLVEAILSRAGRTYATPGNRNNEIGMPMAVPNGMNVKTRPIVPMFAATTIVAARRSSGSASERISRRSPTSVTSSTSP